MQWMSIWPATVQRSRSHSKRTEVRRYRITGVDVYKRQGLLRLCVLKAGAGGIKIVFICKSALHLTLATASPLCYTKATSSVYHRGKNTFCPQLMPANCSAAKQLPQFCKHSKNAAWNIRIHEKREDQHYGTIMGLSLIHI